MMDSWLCCHPSSLKHVLEAALVGETSSVMRGNKDGGPGILTEGFTIRLNDRVRPVAVDNGGGDSCLVRDDLEHGKAILGGARGVAVSCGARCAFYRPGRRAKRSGGRRPTVEFNSDGFSNEAGRGVDETLS
jgi:hypothetical protein